jgi:hypothetical protein
MDWAPNGLNWEWTEVRVDWTQNRPNSEWTELRIDWTQNGPNPEWTQPRRDSTLTELNPNWDSTPNGLSPDWDSIPNGLNSEWDSALNSSQPQMVQCQGVYQKNGFKNTIIYFSQRRLPGPQHVSSAPCWRKWKPNKLKNKFFFTAVEIVPFEIERNLRLSPIRC